jgi:hypothetical protein
MAESTEQRQIPLDFLGELRRTHDCGALRLSDAGNRALVMGWVHRRRDLGGVVFIHLRDREGVTQVVFHEDVAPEVHEKAELLRSEFVIAVEGIVEKRTPETINSNIPTGEVEITAEKVWILNESRVPPFPVDEFADIAEDVRLKYRYVDLRRPQMQRNVILRSKLSFAVREYLYGQGFLEIETPFMTKSTPEGARDFLVPSRMTPGSFYALPQSPQIFKQLLMVSPSSLKSTWRCRSPNRSAYSKSLREWSAASSRRPAVPSKAQSRASPTPRRCAPTASTNPTCAFLRSTASKMRSKAAICPLVGFLWLRSQSPTSAWPRARSVMS